MSREPWLKSISRSSLGPVLRQLSRPPVCLRGEVAQALYRDGNEQKAAVGAGTGILIGTTVSAQTTCKNIGSKFGPITCPNKASRGSYYTLQTWNCNIESLACVAFTHRQPSAVVPTIIIQFGAGMLWRLRSGEIRVTKI